VLLDRCILENGVQKTVQKYSNKPDCFKLIYQYKIQFGHGNFIRFQSNAIIFFQKSLYFSMFSTHFSLLSPASPFIYLKDMSFLPLFI